MRRSTKRVVYVCGLSALFALAGGCQRGSNLGLSPVEGTVTMDGQPLSRTEVIFYPDVDAGVQGPRSMAITDESGRYRLRALNNEIGAVTGKHRVVIRGVPVRKRGGGPAHGSQPSEEANPVEQKPRTMARMSLVPPNYGSFDKTPLFIDVRPGPQVVDLEVK
jgi:hypothetical protein